jgi:tetratricopeptide (TPR) repeat protein
LLGTATVFLAICAWKWEVVWLPPYEDQAVGLWTEAAFLADTKFDYYSLTFEQNDFIDEDPGPRSYLISIIPGLVALAMRACGEASTTFLIAHLVTFTCGAGVVVLTYGLLRYFAPPLTAGLLSAAMVTTPFFSTQIDMLGMDIPMTLCALAAIHQLLKDRIWVATGLGLLTFLIKTTGGVVTGAIIADLTMWIIFNEAKPNNRRRLIVLAALAFNALLLILEYGLVTFVDSTFSKLLEYPWPDFLRLPGAIYWCPDVVALFFICCLGTGIRLARWTGNYWLAGTARIALYARLGQDWLAARPASIATIMVAGILWTLAQHIFIPRYFTVGLPLVYVVLAWLLSSPVVQPRWIQGAIVALVAFNVLNRSGGAFPAVASADRDYFAQAGELSSRSCAFLERSREYLPELRAGIEMARRIEASADGRPVVAGMPYRWYLENPRLGYVHRPIETIDASSLFTLMSRYREAFSGGARSSASGPILVSCAAEAGRMPMIDAEDEIIFRDDRNEPLVAYRNHWSEEARSSVAALEDAYLASLPRGTSPLADLHRMQFLETSGRFDQALLEVETAFLRWPGNSKIMAYRQRLQRIARAPLPAPDVLECLMVGFPSVARRDPWLAIALEPWVADLNEDQSLANVESFCGPRSDARLSFYLQGIRALRHSQPEEAHRLFVTAIDNGLAPEMASLAHFALGLIAVSQDRLEEAIANFKSSLALAPLPECFDQLGLIAMYEARWDEADGWLEKALVEAPDYVMAHVHRGILHARRKAWDKAVASFGRAQELYPHREIEQKLHRARLELTAHQSSAGAVLGRMDARGVGTAPFTDAALHP